MKNYEINLYNIETECYDSTLRSKEESDHYEELLEIFSDPKLTSEVIDDFAEEIEQFFFSLQ